MDRLLYTFPGLKWSPALLAVLYNSLSSGAEENDASLEDVRSAAARSGSLQRLKWVSRRCRFFHWVLLAFGCCMLTDKGSTLPALP